MRFTGLAVAAASLGMLSAGSSAAAKKPHHVINVVGFQWSWAFNYLENVDGDRSTTNINAKELSAIPDEWKKSAPEGAEGVHEEPGERPPNGKPTLWLPKGEKVQFILTSRDVIHSFWVVPLLMKQDVIPGHTNAFEMTPKNEGTFMGKCGESGGHHSRMLFNVKVVSPEKYREHLKDLAKKGQTGYLPAGSKQTDHARNAAANNQ